MDRWHIAAANPLFQYSCTLHRAWLLFENILKLAANHFAENYSSGECVLECQCPCIDAQMSGSIWLSKWCMLGQRRGQKNKGQKKGRVLTECCHLAQCLLLSVCMVLTSSVAKFCQVWSGLTFSLSRHVYSSPIPLKYTLSAHLSGRSIILHCIWLSMYFLILLLTLFIILCNTLCKNIK